MFKIQLTHRANFKKLNLLKLNDIFTLHTLKFFFNYQKGTLPEYFKRSFSLTTQGDVHSYSTRSNSIIPCNVTNTVFAQNCLRNSLPRTINDMNNINANVLCKVNTHSANGFSNYVKNFIIDRYSLVCNIQNCYVCTRES